MINVEELTNYVEQKNPLIRKAVLSAKSTSLFNLQTGVKHSSALNLLNTTIVFGDGGSCGWNEAGSSTLSQRTLTVGHIKINMAFCERALLDYWTGYEVKVAAGKETLPFAEAFVGDIIDNIGAEVEKTIYQGDTEGSGNLASFDGLIKILDAESDTIKVAAKEDANIVAEVYDAYINIPVEVLPNAAILVGQDTFRKYVGELSAANLYHYDPKVDDEMSITIPGTTTKIYAVAGLNGTNKIIGSDLNNIYFGTDLADDAEVFDLFYSKDNQEWRLVVKFNAGVQVAIPSQVVLKTIA